MNPIRGVKIQASRMILLGLCCLFIIEGCATTTLEHRDVVCTAQGEAPVAMWGRFDGEELMKRKPGRVGAPGLCSVTPVSNPQSASGWLVLGPTGQPTGATAPSNATCMSGTSKCKFPNSLCQSGTQKRCAHAIFDGGDWTQAQACTCICN